MLLQVIVCLSVLFYYFRCEHITISFLLDDHLFFSDSILLLQTLVLHCYFVITNVANPLEYMYKNFSSIYIRISLRLEILGYGVCTHSALQGNAELFPQVIVTVYPLFIFYLL